MPEPPATRADEVEQLRARVAALEQLQEVHERTVLEQAERLEQSLRELRQRAREQAGSEEALREQTGILQSVLDSMSDGVVVADERGRFLLFNPAAKNILGLGALDTTPEKWSAAYGLFSPDGVTPFPPEQLPLARAIRGESVTGVEMFVRNPSLPEGVWLSASARPLQSEGGPVRGGVVVFRDVTQLVRSTQRRAAHHAVTAVLAEAATLGEAVPRILRTVCETVGWAVGAVWTVDGRAGVLRCVELWPGAAGPHEEFLALTRQATFQPGVGLPGRVWADRRPAWISDVTQDPNFPRAPAAARCGLHAAFAFPILVGGEVTGVLEFFGATIRKPDDDLLTMIGSLGSQIGQFMERKRAEEQLRQARERFELCVRGSGDGIWDWEVETNSVYFSPRWKSMLGYAAEDVADRYESWEDLVHPDDRDRVLAVLRDYLAGRIPTYEVEHRLRCKDGSYRWILARGVALRDPSGRPFRMAGSHTDITGRKQMEQRLRDEEMLYHSLVETLPLNIFRKDLQGRFTFGNQRFCDTLGRPRAEILGKTDFDFYPPATARKYHRDDLRVMRTGEMFEDIEEHFKPGGEKLYVQVIKAPVRDARGDVVGIEGIFWDVTARKRAEQELHEAKEAAEAANRAKSQFLANMSHEIRTPMNAVIGMTELVLDTALTAEQRECLETVRKAADHLLTVINDILDFSKIEAGRLDLDRADFALRDTLDDALATLALKAHKQGLELACRIPPEVPDALVGDAGRLRQVLVNLVGNALKFTELGEVVVRVAVKAQTEDEVDLHFEITDTGIGIPADKLPKIFAPFSQVDESLTRRRGGTGLGLAISRRLVELMGGAIWVESEAGRGSRFHFTARLGVQKSAAARVIPAEPARLRGLAVLVVDDNATNRFILEEMLAGWRMRPTAVAGGAAALAALRAAAAAGEPFPLALLDAHMPEMDGFTLAERIAQDPALAGSKVLLLTSGGHTLTAERRRELGLAACLPKPVKQADLRRALLAALGISAEQAGKRAADKTGRQEADSVLGTPYSVPGTQPSEAESQQPAAAPTRSLRILLAEDNPINQNLAVRLLERQGHQVVLANNGLEAVAALERQPIDVVLMDLQMPELDGLEATARIRAREAGRGGRVPIIAMTAYAMKGDKEKCLEAGMDGYVSKPVRPKDLYDAVERLAAAPAPEASPAPPDQTAPLVDWDAALDYVGGDRALLRELVNMFLAEYPRWLAELRQALAAGNVADVKRTAHNLKGSMRHFGARPAFEAALQLETMAREGRLGGAEPARAELERALQRLRPELEHFF